MLCILTTKESLRKFSSVSALLVGARRAERDRTGTLTFQLHNQPSSKDQRQLQAKRRRQRRLVAFAELSGRVQASGPGQPKEATEPADHQPGAAGAGQGERVLRASQGAQG